VSGRGQAIWRPFVWASLGIAIVAGFGLGGLLFLAAAGDAALGLWWPAAAQAHGHAQVFGWAGLMVLGVGFHFLPRLLGAPLYQPEWARWVLGLIAGGILLRAIAQPALATDAFERFRTAARMTLSASGVLELAGASLAVWLLGRTVRAGLDTRKSAEMKAVLPFFLTAFAGLWLGLAINALAVIRAADRGDALLLHATDRLMLPVTFYLFLIPVAVAMAARTFSLYFRTPPPRKRMLDVGLVLLIAGLGCRLLGEHRDLTRMTAGGEVLLAGSVGCFVVGLGIFARRLPLPRRPVRPLRDPIQLHAITAFGWLLVAAMQLLLRGADGLGAWGWRAPLDAEWHALGAGFVTLLILGVGAHLLPGFARLPLRSMGLVWATLFLANGAALLRVGPILAGNRLSLTTSRSLTGSAGLLGLVALIVFAVNLRGVRRSAISTVDARGNH
jgi:uncharacterized protein involved in response to NO